jgi:3-oxoacyl-[acyl-carrier protein] reductase
MQLAFDDKRVIVAGGSRGIGRAIAMAFAEAGAHISICARGAEDLQETAAAIAGRGVTVHSGVCDLADQDAIVAYIAAATAALGGLDILVNNASAFGASDDEASWSRSFSIDVMAIVRASRAAIPCLDKAGGGAILNIASISGYRASARTVPYAAVKAAVINYTMSQALVLAPKKIRVNAIAPGSIEFPGGIWEQRKASDPRLYDQILRAIPWGRLGRPEEIASAALFLCSDLASWVTGQTLTVDGGQFLR